MTYLTTVWQYRHFWMSLVRMDLRTRYRRSLLGVGWSLLQPLAMTGIFCLVFPYFMQVSIAEFVVLYRSLDAVRRQLTSARSFFMTK